MLQDIYLKDFDLSVPICDYDVEVSRPCLLCQVTLSVLNQKQAGAMGRCQCRGYRR
jgi:hypothetical protein